MTNRYDIRVSHEETGPNGTEYWSAYDDQRYDCDGDSEGYYPNYAHVTANSKWDAVRELIDTLEEHDE